jgi:DNA invertase Pin-like site-specific DNA recombinase
MKAALYTRVSTEEQRPDNQERALESFAAERGWDIIKRYQEQASAWKEGHQHELRHLLADCRGTRYKPSVVLVWSLDRLTRQGPAAILNLVNTFGTYGVKVISLQEPW